MPAAGKSDDACIVISTDSEKSNELPEIEKGEIKQCIAIFLCMFYLKIKSIYICFSVNVSNLRN